MGQKPSLYSKPSDRLEPATTGRSTKGASHDFAMPVDAPTTAKSKRCAGHQLIVFDITAIREHQQYLVLNPLLQFLSISIEADVQVLSVITNDRLGPECSTIPSWLPATTLFF